MITTKKIRKVPAHVTACPVCRTRLAPHGANVRVIVDAENEATAINAVTHAACARTVIEFTRERGYTPAEFMQVGVWAEEQR